MKPTTAAWLRNWLASRSRPGDDSATAKAERDKWFAAIDRTLATAPPLTDEKARQLANLLGLRSTGIDPGATTDGGDGDAAA